MDVYTQNGTKLSLMNHALASGGEGAVYCIQGYPNKLIKIYTDVNDAAAKEEKIRAMVHFSEGNVMKTTSMLNNISWPLSMIYDNKQTFIGFGMNAIGDGMKLDDVYAYPPKENANITMADKINILLSLCDLVESFHNTGNEIGDLNPENIVIYKNMTVGLIDVDSCHLHIDGKTYKCVVCAPGYVAPEIIAKTKNSSYETYQGITFTRESDYFGLAIHCFCMLMNGCHPYKCVKHVTAQGSSAAAKPIDLRVERGETPFFKNIPNITTPDWAPRINDLPDYMVEMFRRAFVDGNHHPTKRPNAMEWKKILQRYKKELRKCDDFEIHWYWKGLKTCPYCAALERKPVVIPNYNSNTFINVQNACSKLQTTTSAHTMPAYRKNAKHNEVFWGITMVLMICAQWGLVYGLYLNEFNELFPQYPYVSTILAWMTAGAGVLGTYVYNAYWSRSARGGKIAVTDYILSFLSGALFTIGGGITLIIAVYLLFATLKTLFYIFIICIVLSVLAGLFSG